MKPVTTATFMLTTAAPGTLATAVMVWLGAGTMAADSGFGRRPMPAGWLAAGAVPALLVATAGAVRSRIAFHSRYRRSGL
jgi:hypothetical protein